jgi:hypothetical protein
MISVFREKKRKGKHGLVVGSTRKFKGFLEEDSIYKISTNETLNFKHSLHEASLMEDSTKLNTPAKGDNG